MDVKGDVFSGNIGNTFKIELKVFYLILLPDNIDNYYILKKNTKKNLIIF